jgi:hypothetical protein
MKQRGKKGESCRNFATKPNSILVVSNSSPTTNYSLNRFGIEVIGFRIVIGGRCDDNKIRSDIGVILIERCAEIKRIDFKK